MKSTIQMLCAAALLALLLSGCRTNNTTNPTTENDINGRAAQPTSASTPQNSVAGKTATVPSTSASMK